MNKISITIKIIGRNYPMKVNASEEQKIREVVEKVNNRYEQVSSLYRTRDATDVMAIMLFDLMMGHEKANNSQGIKSESLQKISDSLDNLIKEAN